MRVFDELSNEQINKLKFFISPEQPFGPENAGVVKDDEARSLFFNKDNVLCQEYQHNTRIIIGRRGSGKTAIISNTSMLDNHSFIIQIRHDEIIEAVRSIIYANGDEEEQFVESIARVWKVVLNTLLMAEVVRRKGRANFPRVQAYLLTCEIPTDDPFVGVMRALRKRAENISQGITGFLITSFLDSLNAGDGTYSRAIEELDEYFRENNLDSIIILDSLEDYLLNNFKNTQVMGGLLKCVGEYGNNYRHIRLCIPGEAYFDIKRCSKNALKDFTKNLLLHWLPSEIYKIIAWRYALYARIYNEDVYRKIANFDVSSRTGPLKIIKYFFPDTITNALGVNEPTLPYIMRHTQLLPRQVIVILNRIFGHPSTLMHDLEGVDSKQIVEGVAASEGVLCDEICSAFIYKYPNAYDFCQMCVPELPRLFDNGLLQRVYQRHGRSVTKKTGEMLEYADFKQMLLEMGVVGRVRTKSDIYAEAEFEYAQPGRLSTSVEDELCLHPIFSGGFKSSKNDGMDLVVYPQKEWFDDERGRHLHLKGGET